MNIVNFLGVVALAVLCTAQWGQNANLGQQINQFQKERADQQAKLADDDKTIKDNAADLDDLRTRLSALESSLKGSQDKLAKAQADNARLTADETQLKSALDKFEQGVVARDAALKDAGDRIQKLQAERNDAVTKFNDLATKYNATVQQLNAQQQKQ
jgi:chromosome segregation ATPase